MPPAGKETSRGIWKVGTLTYTTAGLGVLFFWLLGGDFAWSMKERTVAPILQVMLKKFSASDTLTGVLIGSFPLLISMILSPIVSYKSDRHRGRWGRRIPFLLIPTPISVLAMVGLAFSPVCGGFFHAMLGSHSPGANQVTLLSLGIFWTLFECSTVVANSVFSGLINDVVPQSVLGRFYGTFRALSLIAGIIFNFWLFGKAESAYVWVFLGMGALYGIGFTVMCLKVKEGDYPPPPAPDRQGAGGFITATKEYLQQCFGHGYYWLFYVAMALSTMSYLPFNLFNVYYAKSVGMDLDGYGKCSALAYFISLLLAYPLGALADRFHPLRLLLAVQVLYIITTLLAGMLVRDAQGFAMAFVIHGVIAGMALTVGASIGQRLLPRDNFAQFASAGGIIGGLGGMVVGPVAGMFLDQAHHNYLYTFFMSCGLGVAALMTTLVLYGRFLTLGGPKSYIAPE